MLIRAPLATASRAIPANSCVGMPSGPARTTSSSGPSEPLSRWGVTSADAVSVTSR